jgi:hypothetical protein
MICDYIQVVLCDRYRFLGFAFKNSCEESGDLYNCSCVHISQFTLLVSGWILVVFSWVVFTLPVDLLFIQHGIELYCSSVHIALWPSLQTAWIELCCRCVYNARGPSLQTAWYWTFVHIAVKFFRKYMTSTAFVFTLPVDLVFRQHDINLYCSFVHIVRNLRYSSDTYVSAI